MPGNFTNSSTVAAGDTVLATQYNNLRKDTIKNAGDYATSGGSSDAYTLSVDAQTTAYSAGQVFRFKANFGCYASPTLNVNSIGAVAIMKKVGGSGVLNNCMEGDIMTGQMVEVVYDGTYFQLISNYITSKAGGTGADGALEGSSGTITIDLGGAQYVEKNYTYINLTGTVALAFSNPHANGTIIRFKYQRFYIHTSSAVRGIDLRNLGSTGGAGVSTGSGNAGNIFGNWQGIIQTQAQTSVAAGAGVSSGGAGAGSSVKNSGATGSSGGTAGGTGSQTPGVLDANHPLTLCLVLPGSGGASASTGNNNSSNTSATGGRGAGALDISGPGPVITSCNIDLSGAAGGNANAGNKGGGGGGGGGGAYRVQGTSIADTAVYTKNGGAGGTGDGGGGNGATGGEGLVYTGVLTEFV